MLFRIIYIFPVQVYLGAMHDFSYRRIPGDVCESKFSMNDIVNFIDDKKKCRPRKEEVDGIITEEKNEIKAEEMEAEAEKEKLAKQEEEMKKAEERKRQVCI